MVILAETTLRDSSRKSAHFLTHPPRHLLHRAGGPAQGKDRSAWGLGRCDRRYSPPLSIPSPAWFSKSNGPFWLREARSRDLRCTDISTVPLQNFSYCVHLLPNSPKAHQPTSQLPGRGTTPGQGHTRSYKERS